MRTATYYRIVCGLVAACATGLSGCGGTAGRLPIAPTTGIVKLGGEPVEGVKVSFLPAESSSLFSHGTTDKDGKFTMSTYGLNDGALVGRHRVTITKVDFAEEKFEPTELNSQGYGGAGYEKMMGVGGQKRPEIKNLLPKKYSDKETSGIEITVEPGKDNDVPINLAK